VMAACNAATEPVRDPTDTGSLRGDVEAIVGNICRTLTGTIVGRVLPQMLSETARNPELRAAHRGFVTKRRAMCMETMRRAVGRGEARGDLEREVTADLIVGPIFYRHLVTGAPLNAAFRRAHVDAVLRALSSR
jgi:hypothetical protein